MLQFRKKGVEIDNLLERLLPGVKMTFWMNHSLLEVTFVQDMQKLPSMLTVTDAHIPRYLSSKTDMLLHGNSLDNSVPDGDEECWFPCDQKRSNVLIEQ